MGLQLTVGRPEAVFTSPYARKVTNQLVNKYPDLMASISRKQPWRSEELPWSGWAALQASVAETIRKQKLFHLGSVDAWCGVFLPGDIKPMELKIPGGDAQLQVA